MVRESIAILDVGHGNSAVISDENATIVIDAGPKGTVLEYLNEIGASKVDVVLISHADQDHVAGLLGLLACEEIEVDHVRVNTDSMKGSAIWDDLVFELAQLDEKGDVDFQVTLVAGSGEKFTCAGVELEVLAPTKYLAAKGPGSADRSGRKITSNSISAVVRLVAGGEPIVLLPGDMDQTSLDNLLESGVDMRARTLVYPHHGGHSGTGKDEDFVRTLVGAVGPENVVFSIGRGRYGNPKESVLGVLKKDFSGLRILCTQLSEHCASAVPAAAPNYVRSVVAQGRDTRKCCAGSIVIDPCEGNIVRPERAEHEAYIDNCAPTALCRG